MPTAHGIIASRHSEGMGMIEHLGIRNKFLLAFGILFALLALFSTVSILSLNKISDHTDVVRDRAFKRAEYLIDLEYIIIQMAQHITSSIDTGTSKEINKAKALKKELDEKWKEADHFFRMNDRIVQNFNELKTNIENSMELGEKLVFMTRNQERAEIGKSINHFNRGQYEILTLIAETRVRSVEQLNESLLEIPRVTQRTGTTISIVIVMTFLSCFFLVYALGYQRMRPVSNRSDIMNVAEEGDFTVRTDAERKDERGSLAKSFDEKLFQIQKRDTELELHYNYLKQLVEQRAKDLHLYTSRLKKSNQELQDFAYVASHDLQEPLRKVITFGDRLKDRYDGVIGEQGRDYINRMQNAAERMQTLINDLLTYSRVTTKAQPFVPVDLTKIAHEVIADLEVRIEQTGGHVEIGDLPTIDADPFQMRQLLQNIIGNALKFHKKGEPPRVKIHCAILNRPDHQDSHSHDDMCQIIVEDHGIGFDEKYAEQIFAVFQRLHGKQEYEGTGVGLAVCRKIIERHGGNITAKSTPGKGATFIMNLPAKQPTGDTNE